MENELSRRQRDRQGRRENYGGIDVEKTSQMGQQCTPYHALSTLVSELILYNFSSTKHLIYIFFLSFQRIHTNYSENREMS